MVSQLSLSQSLEDYLKTILQVMAEKQAVRAKEIARKLGVGSSSVTGALKALADRKLINYAPYDVITLTPEGRAIAEDVLFRHTTLRRFMIDVLAVDAETADSAACQMEHVIPPVVMQRLVQFAQYVHECPDAAAQWTPNVGFHCANAFVGETCERCVNAIQDNQTTSGTSSSLGTKQQLSLADLKPGERGRVTSIGATGEVGKRISEMGVTRGVVIEVERIAPLGDPIGVKLRGYHLSLRKVEAAQISVSSVVE